MVGQQGITAVGAYKQAAEGSGDGGGSKSAGQPEARKMIGSSEPAGLSCDFSEADAGSAVKNKARGEVAEEAAKPLAGNASIDAVIREYRPAEIPTGASNSDG